MDKFSHLYRILFKEGIASEDNTRLPEHADDSDLALIHDSAYVDAFTDGTLSPKATRKIGLPWSAELVSRTKRAVGGTLLTARLALRHGIALNTAGGTHHAHPAFGSGFCIFNDLAVTARRLLTDGVVKRVLIFDLDVHQGDGTMAAFHDERRVFCADIHCGDNFPFHKQSAELNVALPAETTDQPYLRKVGAVLEQALDLVRPDIVLYDAGVDVFMGDRLGKFKITASGIETRDRLVLSRLVTAGIPVAAVIGGGYQKDVQHLSDLHATLHRVACSL